MKKITFIAFALFSGGLLNAQKASVPVTHFRQTEQHNAGGLAKSGGTTRFAGDIVIDNSPALHQGKVKISTAFNGWVYAAVSEYDSINAAGGITLRKSIDHGQTWSTIDSYVVSGILYPAFDLVVAGTDTTNLTLYVIGVNNNVSGGTYTLYVDRYNATTGSFIGSNYNSGGGTKIYDVAIASDYQFPAVGSTPYSVAFLYSKYSGTYDSVNYVASIDGGANWSQHQTVMTTGNYMGNVSISYGRSASASNGRFFAAWEVMPSSAARTGHIYTSRNASSPSSAFITPVNLDSISSTMIGLCRNPSIATQYNNTDNDSASVTAVVMVARDYNGDGSDYDMLGFYNARSHYTNFWSRLDVNNSGENDLQPSIKYDPVNNIFGLTYYDSTAGQLPYVTHDFNVATNPGTWTTVTAQYNDVTSNLLSPYPCMAFEPAVGKAVFGWTSIGANSHGVDLYDQEDVTTGIQNAAAGTLAFSLYPNPSDGMFTLTADQKLKTVRAFDVVGKEVFLTKLDGTTYTLGNATAGVYFIKMTTANGNESVQKLIVR